MNGEVLYESRLAVHRATHERKESSHDKDSAVLEVESNKGLHHSLCYVELVH